MKFNAVAAAALLVGNAHADEAQKPLTAPETLPSFKVSLARLSSTPGALRR